MVWLKFTKAHDLRRKQFTIAYAEGRTYNVPSAYVAEIIKAKAAVRLKKVGKGETPTEVDE